MILVVVVVVCSCCAAVVVVGDGGVDVAEWYNPTGTKQIRGTLLALGGFKSMYTGREKGDTACD